MMNTRLLSAVLLLGLALGSAAQPTGWNNGGGNGRRNGYVNTIGPTTDSVLWQATAPGAFGTPIFIEGGRLVTMRFLGLTNAPVECYDLYTGALQWSLDVTNAAGRSLPVGLRDGRVFVVRYTDALNDTLYALDAADGSLLWTAGVTVAPYISETAVFDSTGNLYIYGHGFKMLKLDPATGAVIWDTPVVPMASGSGEMAIDESTHTGYTLELIGGQSYVWAIDLATGQKKYNRLVPDLQPGGNVPQCAPMVAGDGLVVVQLTEDNVAALSDNGTALTLLWQRPITGNAAFSLMCVGADGSIYAPTAGRIIRLDPQTGDTLSLSAPITQGGFFSPRLSAAANGMVYATNGEDRVYAFNAGLQLLWSDPLPNTNTSGVCIAPDGLAAVSGGNTIRVYTPVATSAVPETADAGARVFPNPTTGPLVLDGRHLPHGSAWTLLDGQGKTLRAGRLGGPRTELDLAGLSPGLYLLHLAGTQQLVKVVKE